MQIRHVVPVNDSREHDLDQNCWCEPFYDEEFEVVVHNSLDGREAYERGERPLH